MAYGTKYCPDFVISTHITDEKTHESKWEICQTHVEEYSGNGSFDLEIINIESGEKLTENDWIFEKVHCRYDWNYADQKLVLIDSCGNSVDINLNLYRGSAKYDSILKKENLNEIIIEAVKRFRYICKLNSAEEGKLIGSDIKSYKLDELVNWYEQINWFKRQLPITIQVEIEKRFIERLKTIVDEIQKEDTKSVED